MAVLQWGRECSVQIGEILIECKPRVDTLRVAFSVDREFGSVPPRCELGIWGLSKQTRDQLTQQPELPVEIKAGYEGASSTVFLGILRKAESLRQGPDWILRCSAGDECEKGDKGGKAKLTFAKGTALRDVLPKLVKACGLKPGNSGLLGIPFVTPLQFMSGTDKLEQPLSVYDDPRDELDAFCRSCGLCWSIDDGAFKGHIAGTPTAPGPLLTVDSGLIEPSPRYTDKGHVVGAALLNPLLKPGVGFTVESQTVNGEFLCAQTRHVGDTHGANDWRVEWRGVPHDGFGQYLAERYKITAAP